MSNPWGKYEWKGTFNDIQVAGLTTPMYGVKNLDNSLTLKKQMMGSFGSISKTFFRILGKYVPANTIKTTFLLLCL